MKAVHILCRQKNGQSLGLQPVPGDADLWVSGAWVFDIYDCLSLKGGWIFLHNAKAENSYIGGVIQDVRAVRSERDRIKDRVEFVFRRFPEGEGQEWRGATHGRAWTSGIIDAEPITPLP